jgi:hypothetical protein
MCRSLKMLVNPRICGERGSVPATFVGCVNRVRIQTKLILAVAQRGVHVPSERVADVLLKAALAKIELLSLIKIVVEDGRTDLVRCLKHILQFVQVVNFVNQVGNIGLPSRFNLDGDNVAKIGRRVDVPFASIACVSNHDENSNRKEMLG